MRELLVSSGSPAADGFRQRCDYYIIIDQMDTGGIFACESYGAAVTSRRTGERAVVPNITVSIPRIDELMDLLVRNQVSPTHLRDVVDDWL